MQIVNRKQARALGLSKFFTGRPCKNGHVAERYTQSGTCKDCIAVANRRPPSDPLALRARADRLETEAQAAAARLIEIARVEAAQLRERATQAAHLHVEAALATAADAQARQLRAQLMPVKVRIWLAAQEDACALAAAFNLPRGLPSTSSPRLTRREAGTAMAEFHVHADDAATFKATAIAMFNARSDTIRLPARADEFLPKVPPPPLDHKGRSQGV